MCIRDRDTTGTKDFVLYSEVSFAQGLVIDHTPFTIVVNYKIKQDYGYEKNCNDERLINLLLVYKNQ